MAQVVVGTAFLRVNGKQLPLTDDDVTMSTLTRKRTPLIGIDGFFALQEEFTSPMIEGQLRDSPDVDLLALTEIVDTTVVISLANGSVFELSNAAFTGDDGQYSAKTGAFAFKFNAKKIRRII